MIRVFTAKGVQVWTAPADPVPVGVSPDNVPHVIHVDAALYLGFGVTAIRTLIVEGVQESIPPELLEDATYCMVLLLGGKKALVQADDDSGSFIPLLSRVFLDYHVVESPVEQMRPRGFSTMRMEVGTLWAWLREHRYGKEFVKRVLNGGPVSANR